MEDGGRLFSFWAEDLASGFWGLDKGLGDPLRDNGLDEAISAGSVWKHRSAPSGASGDFFCRDGFASQSVIEHIYFHLGSIWGGGRWGEQNAASDK